MTNQHAPPYEAGVIPAPYDDKTFPSAGLGISLDEFQSLTEYLYLTPELRAPGFYFYNLAMRSIPPGSWAIDTETTGKILGVPPAAVELILNASWQEADDGRRYHPFLVEIVRKDIERREKNRERVARHREKGSRKRKPIQNDRRAKIPYKDIADLYNELLPTNPECLEMTNGRRDRIRGLWNGDLSDLDRWRSFFSYVSTIPFLVGKESSTGRKPFRPNIDWLLKPEHYLKIKERGYE